MARGVCTEEAVAGDAHCVHGSCTGHMCLHDVTEIYTETRVEASRLGVEKSSGEHVGGGTLLAG